jgi:hypothetical protein
MVQKIEIYSLNDPYTYKVRYIGKAKDSQKRLKSHIRDSKRRNTPVYQWIRSLAQPPKIGIILIKSKEIPEVFSFVG